MIGYRGWIALAALLASGCASSPQIDRKAGAGAHMQMGITYLRQNNIPMAMRELSEASQLDPDNPEVELGFGFAYQARGENDVAERHFRAAISRKPDYPEAHNGLGSSLSFQGKSDEALREFEIAAKDVYYISPELAWFNMGEEYRRLKRYSKADEMYGKAISVNDKFLDAYLARTSVLVEEKRIAEGVNLLEGAVSRNPGFIQGQMELGRLYVNLERREDARKIFMNILATNNDPAIRRQVADQLNLIDSTKR